MMCVLFTDKKVGKTEALQLAEALSSNKTLTSLTLASVID